MKFYASFKLESALMKILQIFILDNLFQCMNALVYFRNKLFYFLKQTHTCTERNYLAPLWSRTSLLIFMNQYKISCRCNAKLNCWHVQLRTFTKFKERLKQFHFLKQTNTNAYRNFLCNSWSRMCWPTFMNQCRFFFSIN